jgi:hypothetical protein
MRFLKLKMVEVNGDDRPSIKSWVGGLRNVPLDVMIGKVKLQLHALGFDLNRLAELRSGLLEKEWNGFPKHALVISTGKSQDGVETYVVSD